MEPWSERVRRFYRLLRAPAATVPVITAIWGRFIPYSLAQEITLTALALLILQVLFEISDRVRADKGTLYFSDFFDAVDSMRSALDAVFDKHTTVRIRWLGMSMGHAWPFLGNYLDSVLKKKRVRNLTLELAMLDGSWHELPQIAPGWVAAADANYARIQEWVRSRSDLLQQQQWKVTVVRYAHMPTWHGMLLNDGILFLSYCRWEHGTLSGGENPYERLRGDDHARARDTIRAFISRFDLCGSKAVGRFSLD